MNADKMAANTPTEDRALSAREHDHYREISDQERECDSLEEEYLKAKGKAANAKQDLESAIATMRASIRRGPDPQATLAFREDWRDTPIGEALVLTAVQAETLEGAGIKTVDQFELLRSGEGLTSLPRIGQATADKWEDAILDWISAAHLRDANAPAPDADEGGDE